MWIGWDSEVKGSVEDVFSVFSLIMVPFNGMQKFKAEQVIKIDNLSWPVWLSGFSAGLQTKGSLV